MENLCDACAGITYPMLLTRNGVTYHSLPKLIENVGRERHACSLCKLLWWAVRYDQDWLKHTTNTKIPIWLWRPPLSGYSVLVITGPALMNPELASNIQANHLDTIINLKGSIAVGTLCLYGFREWTSAPNIGLVIESDPSSKKAIELVRKQVTACIEDRDGHYKCFNGIGNEYPKRVVDLLAGHQTDALRLCDVCEINSGRQRLDFVALSYCWGQEQSLVATSKNLETLKTQFSLKALPQTIQDAIIISRELGIRYLWVDALCIIQGDDDIARQDWEIESSRMADIYGSCTLTLSAAGAKTVSDGMLNPRLRSMGEHHALLPESLDRREKCRLLAPERTLTQESLEPLSQRAWALQEKMLSNRNLIYGTSEIVFSCRSTEWREGNDQAQYSQHTQRYQAWQSIVEEYTTRQVSKFSDRLVAIEGLAQYFYRTQGVKIVKGIRLQLLPRDLLWYPTSAWSKSLSPPASETAIPSWSWGLSDSAVRFQRPEDVNQSMLELQCSWIKFPTDDNPTKRAVLEGDGKFSFVSSMKLLRKATYDNMAHECCPLVSLGCSLVTYLDQPSDPEHQAIPNPNHKWNELHDVWFLMVYATAGLILRKVPDPRKLRHSPIPWLQSSKAVAFKRIGMWVSGGVLPGDITRFEDVLIY